MDPTSGGAGSSDTNSGEGPSSATAPAVVFSYDLLSDVDPSLPFEVTDAMWAWAEGDAMRWWVEGGKPHRDELVTRAEGEAMRWWAEGGKPHRAELVTGAMWARAEGDAMRWWADKPHRAELVTDAMWARAEGDAMRWWAEGGKPHRAELVTDAMWAWAEGDAMRWWAEGRKPHRDELVTGAMRAWVKGLTASTRAPPHRDELVIKGHILYPWAPSFPVLAAILSNQGESSGSGGRAGEDRNGGGGDGNQGIGGGVGGGGQREGIGTGQRGSRGSSHGGGNGDDDDNDRRRRVRYMEDGRRPMDPRPDRMPEILLSLNVQIIGTLESLDVTRLSARARILRDVSLGFNSGSLVCLSASIQQRGTNPRLSSILSWIGSVATFLGFISMIDMALLASFIP